jgi:hypothetical protein
LRLGLGVRLGFLLFGRALERAAGLGEEDVVEARRMQLELLQLDPLRVERPDDAGQVLDAVLQPDRDAFRGPVRPLAELLQDAGDRLGARAVCGDRLDRKTVTPSSRASRATSAQSALRLCGSRPVVGSSRKRIVGRCARASARSSLRFMPPE